MSKAKITKEEPVIITEQGQQPKLNVLHTVSIMISSIGGNALFVAMTTIVSNTQSVFLTLLAFLLSGLLNLSLAMCFSEVAVQLPKAGGPYFFILDVYGEFPAFLFMWGFILFIVSPVWGLLPFTSSLYIVQLFFPGCRPPDVAIKLLAICILVIIVALNCLYLKYVTKVQAILSSTKLLAMLLIIACGVYSLCQGETENFKSFFEGTEVQPGKWALSILAGMFTYGGWQIITFLLEEMEDPTRQIITFLLEEMEDPTRNLPKALSISFAIVISLNVLVVMAYFTLISPREMLDADAVAVLFMEKLYFPLAPVISIFVTSTSIGTLNAIVLAHSRLVSTAAKRRHLPNFLATSSEKYKMPWAATIFLSVLGTIILVSGSLTFIIEMVSFYAIVMGLAVLACLFGLRVKRPHAKRTIKVWLGTAIFQFVLNLGILLMSIYQKPYQFGQMVLIVASGFPIYVIFIQWKSKPKVITHATNKFCLLLQKLLMLKFD